MYLLYLYGSVFSLSETPQRGEKVDVSALDKLSLCSTELLLNLSTPQERCSYTQNVQQFKNIAC